ncbi:MAG: PAS domain S-box protein [Candidatus Omnitrophica bacterium]|nr:PAS domain S-box protein [Candidatus Omnitrophota bacterium]
MEATQALSFPIVGIGASSGGLEAFSELLKNLPPDTGMAFVLVCHLDPTHKSQLTQIIGRLTKMPSLEVTNRMPVRPDCVYIIPPNKNMTLSQGKFRLVLRTETLGRHLPIDCFLTSLSLECANQSIGIILSGAASDGIKGQKAIKSRGGITMAQEPASAKQDSMPRLAIASGFIDYVLSPKAIAAKLVDLSRHLPLKETKTEGLEKLLRSGPDDLARILILLRYFKGVDFTHYKKTTVDRRIKRRLVLTQKATFKEYLKYLRRDPKEVENLFADLLINVTNFFRDPKLFRALEKKVFPKIFKHKRPKETVRIWVPACSSGEEVYSLAISWLKAMGSKAGACPLQVFATDVNEAVIRKARKGLYPESIQEDVSPAILRRYFVKEQGGWRIIKSVRDMCIFAAQDLTRDPPFSKIDLISCRNMLIYMDVKLQRKIIPLFHYGLNPSGILVLGSAESAAGFTKLFATLDSKLKIYAKKESSSRSAMYFEPWEHPVMQMTALHQARKIPHVLSIPDDPHNEDAQARDEQLRSALEEIQSANEELQSSNEELETSKEELQASNEELVTLNDELSHRNIELALLGSDILNLFNSTRIPVIMVGRDLCIRRFTPMAQKVWNLIPSDAGRKLTDINPNIKVSGLEGLLSDAMDHMKITETELQDNEGRWYSMTVSPYKTIDHKIDGAVIVLADIHTIKKAQGELEAAGEYFKNIVEALSDSMIVLDHSLRVRGANKAFYDQFKVLPKKTEGQLIYDLGNGQWDISALRKLLKEVLSKNTSVNDYEISHKFPRLGHKDMLLNARIITENILGEHLILLSIKDITDYKKAGDELKQSEELYRSLFENMFNGFAYCQMHFDDKGSPCDFTYLSVNAAFKRLTGLRNVVGRKVTQVIPGIRKSDPKLLEIYGRVSRTGKPERFEFFVKGLQEWFLVAVYSPKRGYFVALFDVITQRKQTEEFLKKNEEQYRELVQNANSAIIRWKVNGKISFFNEYAEKFFGWRLDEVMGRSVNILLPDQDSSGVDLRGLAEDIVAHPNNYVNNVNENICRDGRRVWMTWTNRPILDEHGKVAEILAVGIDITERKRAQEQAKDTANYVQTILSASSIAVITYKASGEAVSANEAAARLVGTSVENLKKQNFRRLDSWKNSGLLEKAEMALKTGKEQMLEEHATSSYGADMWMSCRFVPFYFEGQPHLLFMAVDISERMKIQIALKIAKEQAETANKYKTEFLTNISHDLRTPLNSILGFAHLLRSVDMEEKYRKGVDYINEQGKHLLTMVDELLSVSRMDSGKMEFKSEEFNLQKLLEGSIETSRLDLGTKDVKISLKVHGNMPSFKGDISRLQQVMDNLLGNAVKYTQQGSIELLVGFVLQQPRQDKCLVKISIKDTGIGIPADKLPFVFDSFTRFHDFYRGQVYDGVGLGLYIVKRLVTLMGGDISVSSEVGRGTEFIVTLNLDKV